MADRPKMPVPAGEMLPRELAERIRAWAAGHGYNCHQGAHASEFAKMTVGDSAGKQTTTVIPNAHHGRRLKKNQVRYTVKGVNDNWTR